MALPLIPIAIASLVGGGGFGLGSLLGKGKKEQIIETHAPYEHYAPIKGGDIYAPTTAYAPVISQAYTGSTYIISSPGAESKKETVVRQKGAIIEQQPYFEIPTIGGERREQGDIAGMSVEKIAIIAVVGAVIITGIGAMKKKK